MDGLNRKIWVTTPTTPQPLMFERMSGEEELGRAFRYEVDMLCESGDLDLEELLGKKMTVTVEHKHGLRHFNGVCTQFRVLGTTHRYIRYRATLRPELYLLNYTRTCRIFQKRNVPDIVKHLLKGRVNFDTKLQRDYRTWDYLVQYRESDFAFVCRLMEQEGIYFFFDHTADGHQMLLVDDPTVFTEVAGYKEVPFLPPEERGRVKEEHISGWEAGARIVPGIFTVRDFRFDKPTERPASTVASQLKATGGKRPGADFEVYDYPGEHRTVEEAREEARNLLLEQEAQYQTSEANGDTRGLAVGNKFTITNLHRARQSEKPYAIIKASYTLVGNSYESDAAKEQPEEFKASYTLIDAKTEYRSPRITPKPVVQGPQTATVVGFKNGPADDEIATDKDGRVMVRFHWDRRGDADDPGDSDQGQMERSCFIRVAQAWAGTRFGAIFIPRIGQEVIVDFLEGDPDSPIITGRVYNGDNRVPWDLPGNATQSGILTRSSKGASAANANMLRFEDKKGSEQILIHAEKDQDVEVEHNETHWVGNDRAKTIDHNETVHVKHDRSETVDHDETVRVNNNQTVTVAVNQTVTVGSNQSTSIGSQAVETVGAAKTVTVGGALQMTAGALMSLSVGASMSTTVGGNSSNDVGGGSTENVGKDKAVTVAKNLTIQAGDKISLVAGKEFIIKGKNGLIDMSDELKLQSGGATITLKKNGDITIEGKKITIKGSGDLVLKGSKISEN